MWIFTSAKISVSSPESLGSCSACRRSGDHQRGKREARCLETLGEKLSSFIKSTPYREIDHVIINQWKIL